MKIVAVRIGDKYGPEYEKYLENKLPQHEFIWVREPINDKVQLQWNKMYGMNLDIDEPIVVMDIDVVLVNDYEKLFDYPIEKGEVVAEGTHKELMDNSKIYKNFYDKQVRRD